MIFKEYHLLKDNIGRFRTRSLFFESNPPSRQGDDGFVSPYSLKDHDHEVDGVVYYSLKKIYMSYNHIPGFEYDFAMDVFNSWDHWVRLTDDSSVRKVFAEWRNELEVKLRSEAIKNVIQNSKGDRLSAKWLAEQGWKEKTAGRPSREEVARERKIAAGIKDSLEEDMERLGLTVIQGKL